MSESWHPPESNYTGRTVGMSKMLSAKTSEIGIQAALSRRLRRDGIADLSLCGWQPAEIAAFIGCSDRTVRRTLECVRANQARKRRLAERRKRLRMSPSEHE
jgi:hypothetical protein